MDRYRTGRTGAVSSGRRRNPHRRIRVQRPLVLTEVLPKAAAVFGDYGLSDAALLGVVLGKAKPGGHLPFELPSSKVAVERQYPDVPNDSTHPLFPHGFGLSYSRR